jgi:hypothetical protein
MNEGPVHLSKRARAPRSVRTYYVGLAVLALLLLGSTVFMWRRLRPGVIVTGWSPQANAQDVSTRAAVRIAFAGPMLREEVGARFQIEPPVEGTLRWEEDTLLYRPTRPLAAGQAYTATLRAGAHTARGRQVTRDITWRFAVGRPRLTYIALDEAGRLQLYAEDPHVQLTDASADVWDYAVHPEGRAIAYSVVDENGAAVKDGAADLWQVDRDGGNLRLLLACAPDACAAPAWSFDGRQIAYERQALSETTIGIGTGPVVPHIWLLDTRTGDTRPLVDGTPTPGRAPTWAPSRSRLAFYDLTESAVRIVDLEDGQVQLFDTLGNIGTWDPEGERMVLADLHFHDERVEWVLVQVEFATRKVLDLGSPPAAGDSLPHWSPTGEWIAFARNRLGDGTPTPGTQLWLMRPDGSDARPLAQDAAANLGAYAWRPDGAAIAYIRVEIADLADPNPELWVVSLEDGNAALVAAGAVMPDWLP